MSDRQLLRYARHLMLEPIGIEGQQRLLSARVLIVGAGGLGSPAALYLGGSGVGRLTVVDDDVVDLTNLQRQIAHATSRVGLPKADSVRATVGALNPDVQVDARVLRVDAEALDRLVPAADVVLDCSDNFATRQAINAACVRHCKPLVSGAAIGWDAQISVYDTRQDSAPCYACLFPPDAAYEDVACATLGVLAPLVGIVGSMQAAEALKLLLADPALPSLAGRLLMLDARQMVWDSVAIARQPQCVVCGERPICTDPTPAPNRFASNSKA
ncbi:MAG: HesA/MoeB/ThiF family protein [Pseudomonadota bacterium]|nr:HesA/MoeB/ThiF family protein [Pseudomonadota bacterium]